MYNLDVNDNTYRIVLEASGNISKSEYVEILTKMYSVLDNNTNQSYKVLVSITDYKFYFWQLPFIMKLKNLAGLSSVEKMSIVLDERFARTYGIRRGIQEYKNQIVCYEKEEAEEFLNE